MPDDTVLASHRYGWSKFELITLFFLTAAPVALLVAFFAGLISWGGATLPIIIGIFLASDLGLFYIGRAKKRNTALTATLVDGILTVKGHGLDSTNTISLSNVHSIGWRDDKTMIVLSSKDDSTSVKIPARLASDASLRTMLRSLVSEGVPLSKGAEEVLTYYDEKK